MKQFNLTAVLKLPLAPVPAPFPGKYPTRIVYYVEFRDGRGPLYYCGKPNAIAVEKLRKALNGLPLEQIAVYTEAEFDRKSLVSRMGLMVTQNNQHLTSYYHPWNASSTWLQDKFGKKFYRKRVAGHSVYSPYPLLKKEMVQSLRAWLTARGFVKRVEPVRRVL